MNGSEMLPSHSEATSSLSSARNQHIPRRNDPNIDVPLRNAVRLRYFGRYHDSETQLKSLITESTDEIPVLNELAISYVFQGNFGKLLQLFDAPDNLKFTSKDDSLSKLLLDCSRMHTELMLAKAVETSSKVLDKWLANRKIEEYDDEDVTSQLDVITDFVVAIYNLFLSYYSRMGSKIAGKR
jgi:hypothetical protein